jgi:hypothetical protein
VFPAAYGVHRSVAVPLMSARRLTPK